MSKQTKLLLVFLFLVIFISSLFLLLRKNTGVNQPELSVEAKKINTEKMAVDYKKEVKVIINSLLLDVDDSDFSADTAKDARNRLIALTVPTEFRDLHLSLFKAVTKIEDSLVSGDKEGRLAGKEEIKKIITDYPWLN